MEKNPIEELCIAGDGVYELKSLEGAAVRRMATASLLPVIESLLRQLTTNPVVFGETELKQLLSSSTRLFMVSCEGEIAGMLSLCSYLAPTGRKSWIEDVVVDSRFRGRSLGRRLIEAAIAEAGRLPGNQLLLTSRPSRVAANALYRSSGFEQRETNVYRMKFQK